MDGPWKSSSELLGNTTAGEQPSPPRSEEKSGSLAATTSMDEIPVVINNNNAPHQSSKRQKQNATTTTSDDAAPQAQELQVVVKDSLDTALCKSVLLQKYLEAYGNCLFVIAPVCHQVLEANCAKALFTLEDGQSETDNALLLNFYIALALG